MANAIPSIQQYMTKMPHSIGVDQKLSTAHAKMREHSIRHLPVLSGGRLVGMITDRDLHRVETLPDVDPTKVTIEDAMTPDVHAVSPETPLEDVVEAMAQHKYGSTVVMVDAHVVGIFTTVDACRVLGELLHARHR